MKILAINTKSSFNIKPSKAKYNQSIKQTMGVDSFTFRGQLTEEKKKSQDELIDKTLAYFTKVKRLKAEEKFEIAQLERNYEAKFAKIDKQIDELTKDPDFIADTVILENEKTSWANVVFAVYQGVIEDKGTSDEVHKIAEEKSKEQARVAINAKRNRSTKEFLREAPQKLEDEKVDAKYQKLLALYQEKIDLQNELEKRKDTIAFGFITTKGTYKLPHHVSLFDYPEYMTSVAKKACKEDPKAKKVWDKTYNQKLKRPGGEELSRRDYESAEYLATLDVVAYLRGYEDKDELPF